MPALLLQQALHKIAILIKSKNFLQYKTTTDKIAPNCIATVNTVLKSSSVRFNNFSAIIMWPVEEMGINSVIPSTIAMMMD